MRVEEDKEINRPIAPVFAIIAFRLAQLGRNRLANLADELMRAFIKAYDGSLWIMPFGVEVEHVFHPGDINSIDLRDAPHVPEPGLEIILGQAPADGLARQAVMLGELDHLARQQFQRPALAAPWAGQAVATRSASCFPVSLRSPARARLLVERGFRIAFHKAALGSMNRRSTDPNAFAIVSSFHACHRPPIGSAPVSACEPHVCRQPAALSDQRVPSGSTQPGTVYSSLIPHC